MEFNFVCVKELDELGIDVILGKTRLDSARAVLVRASTDPDPDLRALAVAALGDLHDSLAVAPLLSALRDQAARVREAAADALGGFRIGSGRFAYEYSYSVAAGAAEAFASERQLFLL